LRNSTAKLCETALGELRMHDESKLPFALKSGVLIIRAMHEDGTLERFKSAENSFESAADMQRLLASDRKNPADTLNLDDLRLNGGNAMMIDFKRDLSLLLPKEHINIIGRDPREGCDEFSPKGYAASQAIKKAIMRVIRSKNVIATVEAELNLTEIRLAEATGRQMWIALGNIYRNEEADNALRTELMAYFHGTISCVGARLVTEMVEEITNKVHQAKELNLNITNKSIALVIIRTLKISGNETLKELGKHYYFRGAHTDDTLDEITTTLRRAEFKNLNLYLKREDNPNPNQSGKPKVDEKWNRQKTKLRTQKPPDDMVRSHQKYGDGHLSSLNKLQLRAFNEFADTLPQDRYQNKWATDTVTFWRSLKKLFEHVVSTKGEIDPNQMAQFKIDANALIQARQASPAFSPAPPQTGINTLLTREEIEGVLASRNAHGSGSNGSASHQLQESERRTGQVIYDDTCGLRSLSSLKLEGTKFFPKTSPK